MKKTYLLFISVRDAQGHFPPPEADDPDSEDYWCDVEGLLLLDSFQCENADEAWVRVEEICPDTARDAVTLYEVDGEIKAIQ